MLSGVLVTLVQRLMRMYMLDALPRRTRIEQIVHKSEVKRKYGVVL